MIPSNSTPKMTRDDVRHFRTEMSRRLRGDFTNKERLRLREAQETYDAIIHSNGGKNPILGF